MSNQQNEVVLFDPSGTQAVSTRFQGMLDEIGGDLSGGVGGGFAVLSIKGSRFRVKYQGQETPILDDKGDPVGSIEAVIIKANPMLTKQFYSAGFVEGSNESPVCFSLDGKVPSENAPEPQHTDCMTCPRNKWGSKINPETGAKQKQCQDNRKLAIVPAADLKNELFGGPMLLRVPASALKDLAMFSNTLKARGYPYNAVAVRIGFDINVAYPKPTFKAIRTLDDAEAAVIVEWFNSDSVQKILADFEPEAVNGNGAAEIKDPDFEQAPQSPPPAAAPAAPAKPAPAQRTAPAAAKPVVPPAPPAQAQRPAGVTFGKPAATPAPAPAAKAATPPPPPAAARKPAKAPAAPAPQPVVTPPAAEPEATAEAAAEPEVVPGNLEADIASILEDLNGIAGQ